MSSFYELCNLSWKIPHVVPTHRRITSRAWALEILRCQDPKPPGKQGSPCRYPQEFNYPMICYPKAGRSPLANDKDLKKGGGKSLLLPLRQKIRLSQKDRLQGNCCHALTKFSFSFLRGKATHKF